LFWEAGEDALEVIFESQIEETVGFVKDENFKRRLRGVNVWGGQKFEEATGRRNEKVRAVLEECAQVLSWGGRSSEEELGDN
jgi:hypothetical protein